MKAIWKYSALIAVGTLKKNVAVVAKRIYQIKYGLCIPCLLDLPKMWYQLAMFQWIRNVQFIRVVAEKLRNTKFLKAIVESLNEMNLKTRLYNTFIPTWREIRVAISGIIKIDTRWAKFILNWKISQRIVEKFGILAIIKNKFKKMIMFAPPAKQPICLRCAKKSSNFMLRIKIQLNKIPLMRIRRVPVYETF